MLTHNNLNVLIMPIITDIFKQSFWRKVDVSSNIDECWAWASFKRGKYGQFTFKSINYAAHRVSYYLHYGVDPLDKQVCHKCENRCCNPHHLFLGTNDENQQDLFNKKGKAVGFKGENSITSKLTNDKVISILEEYNNGLITQQGLADKYEISKCHVNGIIRSRSWNHITGETTKPPYWKQERLTETQVNSIVKEFSDNNRMKLYELAEKYNVDITAISNILNGKTWKHLASVKNNNVRPIHATQKLTEPQVLSIIKEYSYGNISCSQLAKNYGVTLSNICAIVKGKTFKHLHVSNNL